MMIKYFNYKMIIKYNGANFYGWAKQPNNLRTVQGELEKILKVKVHQAGRTDKYVHAENQVISFKLKNRLSKIDIYKLTKNIHSSIPDLKIKKLSRVFDDFSPRYNAKSKIYKYKINIKKSKKKPSTKIWFYGKRINIKKVRNASKLLIGKHNFSSFTSKDERKNYERNIYYINIKKRFNRVTFKIKGNSFLRFQVRLMIGGLLAYDRGKYSWEEFNDLILNPKKGKCHYKAPAHGLYLKKVNFK